MRHPVLSTAAALTLSMSLCGRAAEGHPCLPDVQVSVGAPQSFATHAQLASYGFLRRERCLRGFTIIPPALHTLKMQEPRHVKHSIEDADHQPT